MSSQDHNIVSQDYIFNTKEVYGQSLIHLVNLLFDKDIVAAEVGIGIAQSTCTFLQQCPRIVKMYAVDAYKPYANYIKDVYDGSPFFIADEKQADYAKITAKHNIRYSGNEHKVILLEEESLEAVNKIDDNSLDFIFLDAHSTPNEVIKDIEAWYPKVKQGGLFSGHDWISTDVQKIVFDFRNKNNITNKLSAFDNVWTWIK